MTSDILKSAEQAGVTLWVEGDHIRYKSKQPVGNRLKDQIRQHKAEIINLLSGNKQLSYLPGWCNTLCSNYNRLDIPGLGVVQGCYQETDNFNWRWDHLNKMKKCPMVERD